MKTLFKILLVISLSFIILLSCFVAYLFISVKDYNLDDSKLNPIIKTYEFYDNNSNIICTEVIGGKNNYIKIEKLQPYTINAFLSIEDRNFYKHNGINYKRIVSAMFTNAKSLKFKEGASTISQQLIKNTHLKSEKTLKRKVAEFKITKQLEKKYTKNQILEKYLNTIYFGKNAYGINNASLEYFNKTADNLTINESCLLAGIIKAPSKYSPTVSYENAINRKNVVLNSMYKCGYISLEEYNKFLNEEIIISKRKTKNFYDDYILATKNELDELKLNPYNQNNVIKIYTNMDSKTQQYIYELTVNDIENYDRSEIVINSKNYGVIAFYGKNSNLKRCPASCVKPWLVYAPMLNDKFITESSVVIDENINYNGYAPKNYTNKYYGPVTIKDALKNSLNIPPVKLLNGYGVSNANKYTKKMDVDINNLGLSCSLGSINELTLKELCDKYSVFNNDGDYVKSHYINKITTKNGTIYQVKTQKTNVFTKETSYIINDILKESTKSGTSKKLKDIKYDVCAKTGTNGNSSGNKDAYSIAYTTENIIGVWIGKNDGGSISNKCTGGSYPTIITNETLNFLYKDRYPKNFCVPENIVSKKINKDKLLSEQKEYIDNINGENFYYIKGTEPKNYLQENLFKCDKYDITLNDNKVKITTVANNVKRLKISVKYNNNEEVIYNDLYITEFNYKLINFGVYEFTIYLYDELNNELTIKLNTILYNKINPPNNWWER